MALRVLALLVLVLGTAIGVPAEEPSGRIEGTVSASGGEGIPGVVVAVDPLSLSATTDAKGKFSLAVPAGSYSLKFSLGDEAAVAPGIVVRAGETTRVDEPVSWLLNVAESITVTSASRRRERIVEAPAAVTVVSQPEIARQSSHGELPKLLATAPGAELTQSGLYDFNFNLRGFNTSLNRRVLVLIDGRDPSIPFLASQEWGTFSFPLYDIESIELVHGPASALYGSDAFNGVINLVTRPPRESQGGTVQLAAGDLATRRLDGRYSRALGGGWYGKLVGGAQRSHDFSRSRESGGEYPGLPAEAIAIPTNEVSIDFGGLRLDKDLAEGTELLTLEGGTNKEQGVIGVTNIGRIQVTEVSRPWLRFDFNAPRWNFLAARSERHTDLRSLATGGPLFLDESRSSAELQGNTEILGGRGQLVGGASFTQIDANSADPRGVQTLMFQPERERRSGVFAQADSRLGDHFKAVAALRWDDSSLRKPSFSPKAALVWSLSPNQTLRLSYNEAFQSPNFGETFTQVQVAAPLDLSAVEQALAPALGGVPLGFGHIPFLALGNTGLRVEKIRSYELGYSGILGHSVFLTVDLYRSSVRDFVSTLLPQLGTSLGRVNSSFGPYQPPAALTPQQAALVLATLKQVLPPEVFALLSNNVDGSPIFATLSFANVGQVQTEGADVAVQCLLPRGWSLGLSYSVLSFDTQKETAEDPILPNTGSHRLHASLTWTGSRFDSMLSYRWVDGFQWSGGIFRGPVPSYGVVDWAANYQVSRRWSVGVDVSNLLNKKHYEMFGGDLLSRRALGHLTYSW